jgi:hypothetical protein
VSRRWLVSGVLRGRSTSVLDVAAGDELSRMEGRPLPRLRAVPDPDAPPPAGTGPDLHAPVGPLEVRPALVSPRDAEAMLRTALSGVVMGRADRAAVVTLARTTSPQLLVAVASLIERARREGHALPSTIAGGAW